VRAIYESQHSISRTVISEVLRILFYEIRTSCRYPC